MEQKKSPAKSRAYMLLFFASLISFLVFYIPQNYFWDRIAILYVSYFIGEFIESLIPVFSSLILLEIFKTEKTKQCIILSLKLSLFRLVYTIPYYYLYYMSEGFDTLESVFFMALHSAFLILLYAAENLIFAYLAKLFTLKRAKKRSYSFDEDGKAAMFDISSDCNYRIFLISFFMLIVNISGEIFYAIQYFVECINNYRMSEIYFMLGKFAFALLTFLISHMLMIICKKRYLYKLEEKNLDDDTAYNEEQKTL